MEYPVTSLQTWQRDTLLYFGSRIEGGLSLRPAASSAFMPAQPKGRHEFKSSTDLLGGRNRPRAVDDRRVCLLRPVHAQHEDKIAGRGWKPVGFLVFTRRVLLNVEIGRAVRIFLQALTRAYRVSVERIVHKEVAAVVHGERPEAFGGRQVALGEPHHIFICAIVFVTLGIFLRSRIDRILR